jgi:hypothetical protein
MDFAFPGDPTTVRGVVVTYTVPFTGDAGLFGLKPSTWSSRAPHAEVRGMELRFSYGVRPADIASTKASFEAELTLTKQWVGWVNQDVAKYNERAHDLVRSTLQRRLSTLQSTASGLEALGLPINPKPSPAPEKTRISGSKPSEPTVRYDVALSFAGEDRGYVDEVAKSLAAKGIRVFYDQFEQVELWGKDLVAHLLDIYQNRARFCVIFVSQQYVEKPWPNHERRGAQARALYSQGEYLLPARFDDSVLPGLPSTTGYVDLRKLSPQEFAEIISKKIG